MRCYEKNSLHPRPRPFRPQCGSPAGPERNYHHGDTHLQLLRGGKTHGHPFLRFIEPGRTVNRLVAESINYERFIDGASILQTFRINNVPDQDSPFVARTVIKAKDGSESVIETPFSFGTRVTEL